MGVVETVVSLWFTALPAAGPGAGAAAVAAGPGAGAAAVAAEARENLLLVLSPEDTCTGFGAEPDMIWIELVRE